MRFLCTALFILSLVVCCLGQNVNKTTILNGVVLDQAGAPIESTEIVLRDSAGNKFQTRTDENGAYTLKIIAGTYLFTVEFTKHKAWEKFSIEKYDIAPVAKMTLDVVLRISKEFIEKNGHDVTSDPVHVKVKP